MAISDLNCATAEVSAPTTVPAASKAPAIPNYPRSRIPTHPILSFASFLRGAGAAGGKVRSVLDVGQPALVTSGRVAIALALRQMEIGPGDKVLVPAYHCASMIEPVVWSGATPVFYRVKADTAVDLDDVASKIDGSTRLILAANYFGFPQDLTAIRRFCDSHGLLMLEDCAHCFLGEHQGQPVGSFGDYAIASSMKFFPIYEGGALVSSRHRLDQLSLQSGGLGFEAKSALNALENSFEYDRMGLLKGLLWLPMKAKDLLWGGVKASGVGSSTSMAPGSSSGGFSFDPAWLEKRSSLFSRLMLRLVSRRRMGQLRRRNYLALQAGLADLPHCRPLFPSLPEGVYPWVFPLQLDNPRPVFATLKQGRVPIIRFGEFLWDGVDASVCPASIDLSNRVMSFSCHQELKETEMNWMITQIRDAVVRHGVKQQ